ncbi:MAG: hypothetical protein JWO95_1770 [Verrucomicrobiales bacterium]|nr:hypothetical protein [Verrucomicrobiales bacterium]
MSIDEIRKFLRERDLEAVPITTPPAGTLADFMSWSPENTAGVAFLGGNFPEGVTQIIATGCTADTIKFSDAFAACQTVELSNSNAVNLTIPASTATLILNGVSQPSALNCTFPAGLQQLSLSGSFYTSLPALPDGLEQLDVSACPLLGIIAAFPAALISLTCDNITWDHLPSLAGTQLQILQAANTGLVALPALPATLTQLSFDGSPLTTVPTVPAATTNINASNCAWDSGMVDSFLAQLVTNGALNGNVSIDGTNDAPSAAGVSSANTLQSRGWVVTTN